MESTRIGQRAHQTEDPAGLPPQLTRPDPAQPGPRLPLGAPANGDAVVMLAEAVQGVIGDLTGLRGQVETLAAGLDPKEAYEQRVEAMALARSEISALLADSPTLKQNLTLEDRVTAELRYAAFLLGQGDARRS